MHSSMLEGDKGYEKQRLEIKRDRSAGTIEGNRLQF